MLSLLFHNIYLKELRNVDSITCILFVIHDKLKQADYYVENPQHMKTLLHLGAIEDCIYFHTHNFKLIKIGYLTYFFTIIGSKRLHALNAIKDQQL
jgi:hypothetical protein